MELTTLGKICIVVNLLWMYAVVIYTNLESALSVVQALLLNKDKEVFINL